jgi:hypothetical protein
VTHQQIRGKVEYEVLRDDNIINAYLASLKTVREKAMLRSAENLRATGDPETDAMAKRVLQEEIEKFKKNQARRLARKGDRGDDENRTGVVSVIRRMLPLKLMSSNVDVVLAVRLGTRVSTYNMLS